MWPLSGMGPPGDLRGGVADLHDEPVVCEQVDDLPVADEHGEYADAGPRRGGGFVGVAEHDPQTVAQDSRSRSSAARPA